MSLYFYNLRINFISLLLQTIFIQHFITIHMCEHGIFLGILYAKVCTRLNHLGAKIEKSPNPPPTPSPRSVATLPRKVAIFLGIFYLKCWEV